MFDKDVILFPQTDIGMYICYLITITNLTIVKNMLPKLKRLNFTGHQPGVGRSTQSTP